MKLNGNLINRSIQVAYNFLLKIYIMVNCTNSASDQLPRGQLYKIGEQLTAEPYKKVNRSKLTHHEEF